MTFKRNAWITSAVFPNKVKISPDSRSCKLETFTRPKEISPDSRWSMANSHLVRPKKKRQKTKLTKNNQTVGQMWLGISSDLLLFYQTCPVGPTLLGKTASGLAILLTTTLHFPTDLQIFF